MDSAAKKITNGNLELATYEKQSTCDSPDAKALSAVNYPEGAIKVLDKGFVRLVDIMGDDISIVQAARVSYGTGTKSSREDEGLIRYLMRHEHTSPFEMVELKFHCRMPIFVARQWIRHRTASVNELSGRYSELPDMFYQPEEEHCTLQSTTNKQGGRSDLVDDTSHCKIAIAESNDAAYNSYQMLLQTGLRRELARTVLPVSQYTEWYWKIDLHNLMHFLRLRLDSHAQYEIRVFAEAIGGILKEKLPITWAAFENYRLGSVSFSKKELAILASLLPEDLDSLTPQISAAIESKGEQREFVAKLEKLRNMTLTKRS